MFVVGSQNHDRYLGEACQCVFKQYTVVLVLRHDTSLIGVVLSQTTVRGGKSGKLSHLSIHLLGSLSFFFNGYHENILRIYESTRW